MDKIKNLSVFRVLAFAVALALILGICSVFLRVTASADTVTNGNALDLSAHQIGSLGKYPVIGLPTSQLLSDYIATADPNSTNRIVDYFVPFTVYNGVVYYSDILVSIYYRCSYFDNLPTCTINLGGQIVLSTIYDSIIAGSDTPTKSTDYRYLEISAVRNVVTAHYTTYPNDFYKCTYAFKSSKGDILSDTNVSSIMYARVLTSSYNGTVDTNSSSYIKDTDSFHETPVKPTGGSDNGRFTCFGNYNDYSYDQHLSDLISESIEYTKAVSYGDYGRGKCYFQKDANDKDSFIYTRVKSKQLVRYNSTDISFTFYNSTDDLGFCSIRLSASLPRFMERESDSPLDPIKFLTQHTLSYYHFNRIAVISSDSLKAIPAKSTVTATLDLTGFTSIAHSGYYLIELVNSISGDVVSSVMFDYENDGQSFKQNNDNIDVKFKYDNGNITPGVDLPPDDTGHINGIPDGGLDSSNNKYTFNYQNPNITDIFGTLDDSINSISDFFQMCFSLLPLAISTIIIGGFALLVLLRVLGR